MIPAARAIPILLALAACTGAEASAPSAASESAAAVAEWMTQGLGSGALKPACGSMSGGRADLLAYVNARQSLSCRDLGYMLRRLPRERTWIVIPASDTAEVCGFLARERIRTPAFFLERAGAEVRESPVVTVVGRTRRGAPAVYHGFQGAALLEQVPLPR